MRVRRVPERGPRNAASSQSRGHGPEPAVHWRASAPPRAPTPVGFYERIDFAGNLPLARVFRVRMRRAQSGEPLNPPGGPVSDRIGVMRGGCRREVFRDALVLVDVRPRRERNRIGVAGQHTKLLSSESARESALTGLKEVSSTVDHGKSTNQVGTALAADWMRPERHLDGMELGGTAQSCPSASASGAGSSSPRIALPPAASH